MSMTIQSSVKDKILATLSKTSKVENTPAEMLRDLDQQMEKRADDGKANVVTDALNRKERVKPRRVRAMAMTIQYGVRGMILTAQSEAFKQENVLAEILHGLDQQMERKGDENNSKEWNSGDDQLRFRWMIYLMVLADATESVSDAIRFDYQLGIQCALFEALYGRKCGSPVLWAEIGESSLIGPELVHRDKLAPRYVGPFKILERIGLVAYRLRLAEELSRVHDTFHVSNLNKCLVDASLHVPLDEIKVDKTLRFVKEHVEIMDCEVKSLKRSRILLVKVCWNSKRDPEFTWEREDYMKSKYLQLFVDRADESAS
ncbi:hypothetical protein Tco_0154733 [Tanacetum coccineum]